MLRTLFMFIIGVVYGMVIAIWLNMPYWQNAGFFAGFFFSFIPIAVIFWRFINYPVKNKGASDEDNNN